MVLTETNGEPFSRKESTIRERIAEELESHQEVMARLAKLEHTLPSKVLDLTGTQVWEKYGYHIHF